MTSNRKFEQFTIVGQGLAGILLAWQLIEAGQSVKVVDYPLTGFATTVAPGIINPLPGRKFKPVEDIDRLYPTAKFAYSDLEGLLNLKGGLWHDLPVLRILNEPEQRGALQKASKNDEAKRFINEVFSPHTIPGLNTEFGSFLSNSAAWVDLPALQAAFYEYLKKLGVFQGEVFSKSYHPEKNEAVIYAEGWRAFENDLWSFIPQNPAKGEMIIVEFSDDLPRDRIFNRSCWAQPIAHNMWRVGATYAWKNFNSEPSLSGAEELHDRLKRLTPLPFRTLDQKAGVRPIVIDYKPVIGPHPEHPNRFIFNGLGSKGALLAPTAAILLKEHLITGAEIPKPWHSQRFLQF